MKRRSGFTMVEVTIVVAIIAIIASVLIPKMTGARASSALSACKGNLKHLGLALEVYANDHLGEVGNGYPTFLVTDGYLKSEPRCPLGNRYYIWAHYPSNWRKCKPGDRLVVCYSVSGVNGIPHIPGLVESPYTVNSQLFNN